MDTEERFQLIAKLPTEEIVTGKELLELLETKERPIAYDGFEPSGMAHIAAGLMRAQKINDLLEADVRFKLLIADWHAWINNKMGGDLDKIRKVGEYLIKVWETFGVDTKKIDVIWASDIVKDPDYWKKVIMIAKETTIARMRRCATIMGRQEKEMQHVSQFFYPAMQCADIFQLECDITQLGMDQRKVNMLAREVGPKIGFWKPVVVSHHLLIGLQGPTRMEMDIKMSKSKPENAIFVHDSENAIKDKLKKAYCPPKEIEDNPVLELCKYVIFRGEERSFVIERPEKYGGNIEFQTYEELEKAYRNGLHPLDLKNAVAREINEMIKPCREYFEKHPEYLEIFK
ncbi:MAG: tyrosine--tRNA ligase [Candidatus Diapherotrites archaeon]|nr:tyrosine--tRNA ligase [Candidatus Diapherotrites archaeon]